MPSKIGINGYGRIGRAILRALYESKRNGELQIAGLIGWHVDVWSLRPAVNVQYQKHQRQSALVTAGAGPIRAHLRLITS